MTNIKKIRCIDCKHCYGVIEGLHTKFNNCRKGTDGYNSLESWSCSKFKAKEDIRTLKDKIKELEGKWKI